MAEADADADADLAPMGPVGAARWDAKEEVLLTSTRLLSQLLRLHYTAAGDPNASEIATATRLAKSLQRWLERWVPYHDNVQPHVAAEMKELDDAARRHLQLGERPDVELSKPDAALSFRN